MENRIIRAKNWAIERLGEHRGVFGYRLLFLWIALLWGGLNLATETTQNCAKSVKSYIQDIYPREYIIKHERVGLNENKVYKEGLDMFIKIGAVFVGGVLVLSVVIFGLYKFVKVFI